MSQTLPKTLLFQHDPEPLVRQIKDRFPDLPLIAVDHYDRVPDILAEDQPEVVFAFKIGKKDPFPREA
ncbi:MAG TPA: hypothetical protein DCS82_05380, partial [Rhodospirillaceae bacterium]|nr:hypothetical protein [Rhodospirillaceae bacterium]